MHHQTEINDIEYMRVACATCSIVDGHYSYMLESIQAMRRKARRTDAKVIIAEGNRWFEIRMCFVVTSDYPYSAIRSLLHELRKRIGNRQISRIVYSIFAGQLRISIPMYEMTVAEAKEYHASTRRPTLKPIREPETDPLKLIISEESIRASARSWGKMEHLPQRSSK